jgi:hypothetical protein
MLRSSWLFIKRASVARSIAINLRNYRRPAWSQDSHLFVGYKVMN